MKTEQKESNKSKSNNKKKTYVKPEIKSEALNSYGAVCNGTSNGGRKASAAGPSFCNSSRLNS